MDSAVPSKLSVEELLNVMNKERKSLYNLGTLTEKVLFFLLKKVTNL